ncbi:MAG: peptidylprolyl isomerase [Bacteroidetes bacterium]|jgi:cyclophilin family peptidyl-prolyl cis-trans isomerase|nr:peptidylprolyl isomerase [Bacteroidota bacterium]
MKKAILICMVLVATLAQGSFAQKKKKMTETSSKDTLIQITTDLGTMKLKLYKETPLHRANFIKLASEGFYDSLLFHRVIKGFMIQGGDPKSKNASPGQPLGAGDVGYKIPAELVDTLYHKKGVLAAARDGNPEKASSGCQFYIVQGKPMTASEIEQAEQRMGFKMTETQKQAYMTIGGSPWLDRNYTVFGEVIEGLDVIDKIADVKTLPGDRPEQDVRMSVKVIVE